MIKLGILVFGKIIMVRKLVIISILVRQIILILVIRQLVFIRLIITIFLS